MRKIIEAAIHAGSRALRRSPKLSHALQLSKKPTPARYDVFVPGLAAPMELAFLSDLHLGWCTDARLVGGCFDLALQSRPDAILLGGDIVEDDALCAELLLPWLAKARQAGVPVFACPGNHDIRSANGGAQAVASILAQGGCITLRNACAVVEGKGGAKAELCSLDDPSRGNPDASLFADPPAAPRVCLCHSPEIFARLSPDLECDPLPAGKRHVPENFDRDKMARIAEKANASVWLFGHTHGGQVAKLGKLVLPKKSYSRALCQGLHKIGNAWAITTSGVGNSGFPLRIGLHPETALVRLIPSRSRPA